MADFNTYQSQADTAQAQGQSAINSFDPTASANSVRSGFSNLYGNQTGTIGNLTDKYASTVANNPSVTSLYSTANDIFGVPQLAATSARLQNQVTNQLPMQQSLMKGFDASQGQVDNATNYNLRFLEPQANAATNNFNTAFGLASNYVQAGQLQNAQNLLPVQSQISLTNDAMARQSTGYTTAAQMELQGLIDKMNAGVSLSQAEITRATALAQAEESYNQAIGTAKIAAQNQIIPAGSTYYNPMSAAFYNPTTKVTAPK